MNKRLSIKQYALLLGILTLSLFLFFGWITNKQIKSAEQDIGIWKQRSADNELTDAINKLIEDSVLITESFAAWQEVRQQIALPSYYLYWKSYRVKSATMLPDDVLDTIIYSSDGVPLSDSATGVFEKALILPLPEPKVEIGGVTSLVVYQTVSQPITKITLGYVGVQLPLLKHLTKGANFRFIDEASLRINNMEAQQFMLAGSNANFSYQLRHELITDVMEEVANNAGERLLIIALAMAAFLYLFLTYAVSAPISLLMQHIKRLRANDNLIGRSELTQTLPIAELDDVRIMLNEYHSKLNDVHNDLDQKNQEFWDLAHHDPLTGILNRRAFNDHWENVQKMFQDSRIGICMILVDVNHFKAINDTYGHQTGDEVLKAITQCTQKALRHGEQLYRLGGDEFASVFLNCDEQGALRIAERCSQAVRAYNFEALGILEPVKISIGVAIANPGEQDSLLDLASQADVAVYQAKRPGSPGIVVYSHALADSTRDLYSSWVYSAVYQAIEDGAGLVMFYQPIVELEKQRTCYYEALIRIRYKDDWILPGSIFPIIEARHLEKELDKAVVRQIYKDLEAGLIPANTGVSINLSAASVISDDLASWFSGLESYLADFDLVIEVTETALVTQLAKATENLVKLADKGFRVALDDFGSGYSSIRYLSTMPVDVVKFDIALIRDLAKANQSTIVTGLSRMISSLGYSLVAEGIEDQTMLNNALKAGFKFGQGYLFGRPAEMKNE